jgi:hypothetical protein
MNVPSIALVPCAICRHIIDPEDLAECSCGESTCESCPGFACSCVSSDPKLQALRTCLRAAAIELAELRAIETLQGAASLTRGQQVRLPVLTGLVTSLWEEVRRVENPDYDDQGLELEC